MDENKMLSLEEVAEVLDISKSTAKTWLKKHNIPSISFGHKSSRYRYGDILTTINNERGDTEMVIPKQITSEVTTPAEASWMERLKKREEGLLEMKESLDNFEVELNERKVELDERERALDSRANEIIEQEKLIKAKYDELAKATNQLNASIESHKADLERMQNFDKEMKEHYSGLHSRIDEYNKLALEFVAMKKIWCEKVDGDINILNDRSRNGDVERLRQYLGYTPRGERGGRFDKSPISLRNEVFEGDEEEYYYYEEPQKQSLWSRLFGG